MVEVSLMLLNQTAMSKVWFTFGLVARVYYRHYCHTILSEGAIIRAAYIHLPEIVMDPDPTPHPRWSNLSFR
ncbi:mgtA regulatory leader peptide MgtL [Klebsiella pneumoniae]|uniref:mgtA regulatory leader peptide MgtL n=1 Tax=Klebsiella pneumoniae TaxID=573 RepID=UPI003394124A